jgi:Phage tail assembly chaperone protein
MEIRVRSNGLVMQENELRYYLQTNYDTLTPEVAELLGVDVVFEGPQASPSRYQIAYRDGVDNIDGLWYTKYSVADMSAEAIAAKDAEQAKNVRAQRTEKLAASDWTQLTDAPINSSLWASYRQQLRDVTAQAGFPWEINWPVAP